MPQTARAWYPYIRLVFLFFLCVGPSVIVGDITVHTHLRRTVDVPPSDTRQRKIPEKVKPTRPCPLE